MVTSKRVTGFATAALALAVMGCWAASSDEDKYKLSIPEGLAFSEFKGYETWPVVALSHSGETLNVIVANPTMMAAYAAGIPGNGRPFPDGSKCAKFQYIPKKSTEAPFDVAIPDKLKDTAFMMKDSKRFADSGGWGYAIFDYDAPGDKFTPQGKGTNCGFACHTAVKSKDYVFTAFSKR